MFPSTVADRLDRVWVGLLVAAMTLGTVFTQGAVFTQGTVFAQDGVPEEPDFEATAVVKGSDDDRSRSQLGRSVVTRRQIDERIAQSAPDALRFEPGVSIQQTAHGQASPYVRGLTGQQVVHLFDGVRMNNGIYRQGPNQYFFTIDSNTIRDLEVLRGSASTWYGSDALGGAILARSIEPLIDPFLEKVRLRPRVFGRFGSADLEIGGRAEIEGSFGPKTAVIVGGGYRDLDLLESGGIVSNPGRSSPLVPRFKDDERTQLGTGFREATFDGRVIHRLSPELTLSFAGFGYFQFDAPRTDQCPPPEAPESECLKIDKQFRTLAYAALRGNALQNVRDMQLIASFQEHQEQRTRNRPRSFVRQRWNNRVRTFGLTFRASTQDFQLRSANRADRYWKVRYGGEVYRDGVASRGDLTFIDLDRTFAQSRGEYIDGSNYLSLGTFAEVEISPVPRLKMRGGGRFSMTAARAAADPESGSAEVQKEWAAVVGGVGATFEATEVVSLTLNVDQGFRTPNLDDLTSRQKVGPGFQFENEELKPERTTTFELGGAIDVKWLRLDAWGFATLIQDGIFRAVREASDCPPETSSCAASRTQFQLVNVDGRPALVLGTEGGGTAYLPADITLRATYALAWGEGPTTSGRNVIGSGDSEDRVPLSRIPPINGTMEVRWAPPEHGFYVGGAMRWALRQSRLAQSDLSDARIPIGGTPGYSVFDVRAGYRLSDRIRLNLVFENVLDAAYRVHGSSINGPGRSVRLAVMAGL